MKRIAQKLDQLSPAKRALVEKRLGIAGAEAIRKSIPKRPQMVSLEAPLPISFAQEALLGMLKWARSQPVVLRPFQATIPLQIKGQLDSAALERTFEEIVRRHEIFRTTFHERGEGFVQVIHSAPKLSMSVERLDELPELERNAAVSDFLSAETRQPFDLTKDILLRVKLLRLAADLHVLLLTSSHLVFDEWSHKLFINEMLILYRSFSTGVPASLPEPALQFADFACWQRQWLTGDVLENLIAYWKQQLAGTEIWPVVKLPFARPESAAPSRRGALEFRKLPTDLVKLLEDFCLQQGVTMFMLLLAALKALLYCYTGKDGIGLVSPVANRNMRETETMMGCFYDVLILRTDLSGDPKLTELLRRVRRMTLGAYEHQDLPLLLLLKHLKGGNDSGQPYVNFNMTSSGARATPRISGVEISVMDHNPSNRIAGPDISIYVKQHPGGLGISLAYEVERFDADDAARMLKHFELILAQIAANPDQQLSDLLPITKH